MVAAALVVDFALVSALDARRTITQQTTEENSNRKLLPESRKPNYYPKTSLRSGMRTDFTQEDEGKPVHDDVYEHIGKIVKVEDGTGYIDLDPSVGEEVKSALGFSNPREDVYPIHDEMVQSTAGEVVRLCGDL